MKVVHINTFDTGGAAVAAYRIHKGLLAAGVDSTMLVLHKTNPDETVIPILPSEKGRLWAQQLSERWKDLTGPFQQHRANMELFSDIDSGLDLGAIKAVKEADIIHLHWVAGVVDYKKMPVAFKGKPVVWTLHDMNAFTGGCHYAGDCTKYMEQCGACPQLGSQDEWDISRQAFQKKADAYDKSDMAIVTPSRWLGQCVRQSRLLSNCSVNVVPYGLPLDTFKPRRGEIVRQLLGIPEDATVVLFGADAIDNRRKGFHHLIDALQKLSLHGEIPKELILLVFGRKSGTIWSRLSFRVVSTGRIQNPRLLSQIYSIAGAFIIPSLEDNLPNTAIEALACGTPVVGFDSGGIRDIVDHYQTGYLAEKGNSDQLAEGIRWVLSEGGQGKRFQEICRKTALERFSFEAQSRAYQQLYASLFSEKTIKPVRKQEAEPMVDRGIDVFDNCINPPISILDPVKVNGAAEDDVERLIIEGEGYFSAGDHAAAINSFKKALALSPNNSKAYNNLGVVHWQMGNKADAIENLKNALIKDPTDRLAVINAGQIFKKIERQDLARNLYLTYLCRVPADEEVSVAWGQLADSDTDKQIVALIPAREHDYLVSAIVSTYSSEAFIAECIENIESQTIAEKIEIVIVDAASPQDECGVVKGLLTKYSNITYIRTQNRIGVYAAWNIAIKHARGQFCISASTNDQLRKDSCEFLARALAAHPDVALVYGDTYLTKTPHETFENNTHYDTYRWPVYSYEQLTRNCMVGPHPMWRRSIHDTVGYFDERYIADGDQEFWLRIGEQYDLMHIPEFTGLQWISPDALSRKGGTPGLEIRQIHSKYQQKLANRSRSDSPQCSIIIPVFNKLGFTKHCLASIEEHTNKEQYEIIVVDNGSTDGSSEFLSSLKDKITTISNSDNLGFAVACNQGARASKGNYLLFLNNDTKVLPGWLDALLSCAREDEKSGVVGAKLLYPDDTIQHAGVEIVDAPHPIHAIHAHHKAPREAVEVSRKREYQAVTAACMLVGKQLFKQVGGFDEGFVNGYEDIDFCFRVRKLGKKVFYCPDSELYHYESRSEGRFDAAAQNIKRLNEKWQGRIVPDKKVSRSTSSNKLTSIIILTHNQLDYTQKCIESVLRHTHPPFELILVDNASTDGTIQYLSNIQKSQQRSDIQFKIVKNKKNLGFAAGNNRGLAEATGDYVLLLNNDVVVTPNWLDKLVRCLNSIPNAGMVGPMTNHVPGEQRVQNIGYDPATLDRLEQFSEVFSKSNHRKAKRVLRVVGFCVLIKRAVIEKIGGLDERYGLGNFEDDDFSLRAALAGFQSWMAGDCFVHHFGSQTFKGVGIDHSALLRKNWDLFKKKWQIPSELPYGGYNMSHIGRNEFDPQVDRIPISIEDR